MFLLSIIVCRQILFFLNQMVCASQQLEQTCKWTDFCSSSIEPATRPRHLGFGDAQSTNRGGRERQRSTPRSHCRGRMRISQSGWRECRCACTDRETTHAAARHASCDIYTEQSQQEEYRSNTRHAMLHSKNIWYKCHTRHLIAFPHSAILSIFSCSL